MFGLPVGVLVLWVVVRVTIASFDRSPPQPVPGAPYPGPPGLDPGIKREIDLLSPRAMRRAWRKDRYSIGLRGTAEEAVCAYFHDRIIMRGIYTEALAISESGHTAESYAAAVARAKERTAGYSEATGSRESLESELSQPPELLRLPLRE